MKFIPKFLLILIFLIIEVNSLYFFISEEIEKCVFDDIPKNQVFKKKKKILIILTR